MPSPSGWTSNSISLRRRSASAVCAPMRSLSMRSAKVFSTAGQAWTGIELLRHPHFLAEVLHEQEKVLAGGRELSFDALRDMVLLERSMREAERLHPPLVVLMRKVIGDFHYQQYDIPRGWLAMVS